MVDTVGGGEVGGGEPYLRLATADDAPFLFSLAARLDLAWPTTTRNHGLLSPTAVAGNVASCAEIGWVVGESPTQLVGLVGFIDSDPSAKLGYLDAVAWPHPRARQLVSAAIPGLLDQAMVMAEPRKLYFEYYEADAGQMIDGPLIPQLDLWEREVVIPDYVRIDGISCSRVTVSITPDRWRNR
jgi:hypothetical protein